MSHKQAKRFRKLNKRTSEYMVTAEVKKTVRKIAISRYLWRLIAILELIGIGILLYFLLK